MPKLEYNYVSPDNFTISYDNFDTPELAEEFFTEWLKGFENQGYYSTIKDGQRYKMPLEELKQTCFLKEFDIEEEDFIIDVEPF